MFKITDSDNYDIILVYLTIQCSGWGEREGNSKKHLVYSEDILKKKKKDYRNNRTHSNRYKHDQHED